MNERIIQEEFERGEQELQIFLDKVEEIKELLIRESELPLVQCERLAYKLVDKLKRLNNNESE